MARTFDLVHGPTQKKIACVHRAETWWERGMGVIGWAEMPAQSGLWLTQVASVHTCFVRFPLDLLFLDAEFQTCRAVSAVRPWRLWISAPQALHTIELAADALSPILPFLQIGDSWNLAMAGDV